MFTVCPKCALTLVVTAQDLRVAQGYVRCGRCSNVFNAIVGLTDDRGALAAGSPPQSTASTSIMRKAPSISDDEPAHDPLSDTGESEAIYAEPTPDADEVRFQEVFAEPAAPTRTTPLPQTPSIAPRSPGAVSFVAPPPGPPVKAPAPVEKRYSDTEGIDTYPESELEFNPDVTDVTKVFVEAAPVTFRGDATGKFRKFVMGEEQPDEVLGAPADGPGAKATTGAPQARMNTNGAADSAAATKGTKASGAGAQAQPPNAGATGTLRSPQSGSTDATGTFRSAQSGNAAATGTFRSPQSGSTDATGTFRSAQSGNAAATGTFRSPQSGSTDATGTFRSAQSGNAAATGTFRSPNGMASPSSASGSSPSANTSASSAAKANGAAGNGGNAASQQPPSRQASPTSRAPADAPSTTYDRDDDDDDDFAPTRAAPYEPERDAEDLEIDSELRSLAARLDVTSSRPAPRFSSSAANDEGIDARDAGGIGDIYAKAVPRPPEQPRPLPVVPSTPRNALEEEDDRFADAEMQAVDNAIDTFTPASPPRTKFMWWVAGAAGLSLLLAAQAIHHNRHALATNALLNRPLTRFYKAIGVSLVPSWDLRSYDVRQLGASTSEGGGGSLTVRASLKNNSTQPLPLPLLRITMQDRYGNRIATRDVPPAGYVPGAVPAEAHLGVGQRIDAEMTFKDPGQNAVGFEIDACLATASGGIACANDAAPAQR